MNCEFVIELTQVGNLALWVGFMCNFKLNPPSVIYADKYCFKEVKNKDALLTWWDNIICGHFLSTKVSKLEISRTLDKHYYGSQQL